MHFKNIKQPTPPFVERILSLVWKFSPRKGPVLDALLSRRLSYLKHLPERNPNECIPLFDTTCVVIQQCPLGAWSTPLVDVVVLAKCAIGFESARILELGSYLGHTAKLLAENTKPNVKITTLDEYADHGTAYRGTSLENKIDRRIGKVSLEHFNTDEKYDLIFVDANHHFNPVLNDTEVAFRLLSERGVVVWHDYQQTNHFGKSNQVPEALKVLSSYVPIISIAGTWLAMHSRHPGWETAVLLKRTIPQISDDPWNDKALRG